MAKQNGAAKDEPVMIPLADADADVDHGLGEFFEPFQKPAKVGEMSHAEVTELRARNKALARLSDDISHYSALRAIAANEKMAFIRSIGARVGLGPRDELTVDDETRDVTHAGRRRFIQPSETEPVEEPAVAPSAEVSFGTQSAPDPAPTEV